MDVTIQLKRKVHWSWDSPDEVRGKNSRWIMMLNGEMMSWLKRHHIEFTRTREKVWHERWKRDCWEVFFHFKDRRQAMFFKLVWM